MKKVLVTTIFAVIMISSSLFYVSCSKETIISSEKSYNKENYKNRPYKPNPIPVPPLISTAPHLNYCRSCGWSGSPLYECWGADCIRPGREDCLTEKVNDIAYTNALGFEIDSG